MEREVWYIVQADSGRMQQRMSLQEALSKVALFKTLTNPQCSVSILQENGETIDKDISSGSE